MSFDLENKPLNNGPLSRIFRRLGIGSLHDACDYVQELPYGRNKSHAPISVLEEKCGTCSSKHALLKMLADELNVGVKLVVGIYYMNESNTPGVGVVLDNSPFNSIPEAHCYLRSVGRRIDLTRSLGDDVAPIDNFVVEVSVEPAELTSFKQPFHYRFLVEKYGANQAKEIWKVREQCIAALST